MAHLLSICIPSLNRRGYLEKAIRSVYAAAGEHARIELCISNNASDDDYSAIDALVKAAPQALAVRYVVQPTRLPVDAHMMAVKNLATAPYVYYLGDDDYFLEGQLSLLIALVENDAPDLAIFNGTLVDAEDRVIGPHFALPARRYTDLAAAFRDLRDKGMFGAVLVKAAHLGDDHFRSLFGTAHAYGCYWFSLFECQARKQPIQVTIPDFPLVALRMAQKSYSRLEVYYRDIPYEIAVYQRYLPSGPAQMLNDEFRRRYMAKVSSLLFLSQMSSSGVDLKQIRDINPEFYARHRPKIAVGRIVGDAGLYRLARSLYRTVKPQRQTTA